MIDLQAKTMEIQRGHGKALTLAHDRILGVRYCRQPLAKYSTAFPCEVELDGSSVQFYVADNEFYARKVLELIGEKFNVPWKKV